MSESVAEGSELSGPPPQTPPVEGEGSLTEMQEDRTAEADWDTIRLESESGEGTVVSICKRHSVSKSSLAFRAKRDLWRMRNKQMGSSGPALLARLYRLLERQIFEMEKTRDLMGDKEAATLGRVAATLEKLMEIERREGQGKPRPKRQSKDLEYLRNKVAKRLEELNRGG